MGKKNRWIDDPTLLIKDYKEGLDVRKGTLDEAQTYAAMLWARPSTVTKTGNRIDVFSADAIRELGFNSLAEVAFGALAQITAKRLKAKVAPVAGTWKQKRTCEALGQLIDGNMSASNFHAIASRLVFDAMWAPEAYAIWEDDGKSNLRCTRLDPLNCVMSLDRKEFTFCRSVSRREVIARYASGTDAESVVLRRRIEELDTWHPDTVMGADPTGDGTYAHEDRIAWYEGYCEGINGYDRGRHVIQLAPDLGLVDEDWEIPVPVIGFHWHFGFRGPADGTPLSRQVAPLMALENQGHMMISDVIACSKPIIKGKVRPPELSDAPFEFIKEDADDPEIGTYTIEVPQVVSREVKDYISDIKDTINRLSGVSETAASGDPPPRYKSGVALEAYIGIIRQRLSQPFEQFRRLHEDSARIQVLLGPKIWKSGTSKIVADGTDILEQISWEDVKLPEESYRISFDTISDLPNHIPSKLELFQIVKDLGIQDSIDLIANLNTPDFQRTAKRLAAPREYIEFQINQALDEGVIEPPIDGMQDRATLAKSASEAWQAARCARVKPPAANMDALMILWQLAAAPKEKPVEDDLAPTEFDPAAGLPSLTPPQPGELTGEAAPPLAGETLQTTPESPIASPADLIPTEVAPGGPSVV